MVVFPSCRTSKTCIGNMIQRRKEYGKREPSRDAHKIYIPVNINQFPQNPNQIYIPIPQNINYQNMIADANSDGQKKIRDLMDEMRRNKDEFENEKKKLQEEMNMKMKKEMDISIG